MKIIVVRCASYFNPSADARCKALLERLGSSDHRTELVILPPVGNGIEALMAAASHRLMDLRGFCDALICLDRVSCLLRHDHKFALLPDRESSSVETSEPTDAYLLNVFAAGIGEAKRLPRSKRDRSKGRASANLLVDLSALLCESE